MLHALSVEYGPVAHGRVVRNGRDPSAFRPGRKEPIVLSVGRLWDDAKNVRAVEQVAARLAWPVHLAGDTVEPGAARASGGAGTVTHLGRLAAAEVAGRMSAASIYALPARYEPFGLSVLEAALAGCALVLGDIPSQRELWDGAAIFVAPEDTDALERAIASLIDDEGLRGELAARARERAARYSTERMATGYMEAYATLVAGARPEVIACA
jgi:glycosyltransferase involved in cell wall biosynthesis